MNKFRSEYLIGGFFVFVGVFFAVVFLDFVHHQCRKQRKSVRPIYGQHVSFRFRVKRLVARLLLALGRRKHDPALDVNKLQVFSMLDEMVSAKQCVSTQKPAQTKSEKKPVSMIKPGYFQLLCAYISPLTPSFSIPRRVVGKSCCLPRHAAKMGWSIRWHFCACPTTVTICWCCPSIRAQRSTKPTRSRPCATAMRWPAFASRRSRRTESIASSTAARCG